MKLSEIKEILATQNIQLTKSLGQNFLHDGNQLQRIAAAGDIQSTDKILEIGPGLGPLTEILLARAGRVLAIEMDTRLVHVLQSRFANEPKLELLNADALRHVEDQSRDWSGWKLVANLPYSVASPILVELALNPRPPERLVATLQLEVARRLIARAGDDDYGVLTALVQLRYEPGELFKIPAGCFHPEPAVDSACITLVKRDSSLLPEAQMWSYVKIVKKGFSERRKMMMKLLKQEWPGEALQQAFAETGLSPQIRAEAVSVLDFARFASTLCAKTAAKP